MRLHGLDPTPYAGPGDLVTAADVARWLEEMGPMMGSIAPPGVRLFAGVAAEATAGLLAHELRARLERERRQACRRGALACWREFRRWVHGWGYGWGDGDGIALDVLARALAFRAAARAK